jgi:hypothetical protein
MIPKSAPADSYRFARVIQAWPLPAVEYMHGKG